jgi:hypothetical protein
VLGYETLHLDDERERWEAWSSQCVAYDQKDAVLSLSRPASNRCTDVQPKDVVARYVHGSDGRLLRSIESEIRMERREGEYQNVAHPTVLIHDRTGVLKARYQEDERMRLYRLPDAPELSEHGRMNVAVIDTSSALDKLVIHDPDVAPSMKWRIATVPRGAKHLFDHLYGLTPPLAQGRIGKSGKVVLTASERQSLWQAMHQDDQIVVLHGSDPVVLAPGVSSAQWQACINPEETSAEACP